MIQIGTAFAIIVYFWKDIAQTCRGWSASLKPGADKHTHDAKLGWGVIYGTIPILILGLLLQKKVETDLRSLYWSAGALIVVGIVMLVADQKSREKRTVAEVEAKDGAIVGLWQCLALVPGASRSGSTIAGSLFLGFTREAAARFSFLLGLPSFLAAGLFEAFKHRHDLGGSNLMPLAVSFVFAFAVGLGCIHWFLKYLQRYGLAPFVAYRILLGLLVLWLVMLGKVPPDAGAKPIDTPQSAAQAGRGTREPAAAVRFSLANHSSRDLWSNSLKRASDISSPMYPLSGLASA